MYKFRLRFLGLAGGGFVTGALALLSFDGADMVVGASESSDTEGAASGGVWDGDGSTKRRPSCDGAAAWSGKLVPDDIVTLDGGGVCDGINCIVGVGPMDCGNRMDDGWEGSSMEKRLGSPIECIPAR
ncbi:hypothetical protein H310_03079 [Aphanomyces invadans]|uniref:Uncharacterized protein n=1 Tax=Aphanomyces invadans TaxID=157072 RepID=A0A024UMA6_9STRA|nr:hypothetical protein H310_03079 [Aphanomyces invadans]ETW06977.1 hypothetical protein H310_03079 [Aphanomyces invadans]|eukprot:XP_008865052.1 hypothetical protein H310_03079 [Aphanomyces invadans]